MKLNFVKVGAAFGLSLPIVFVFDVILSRLGSAVGFVFSVIEVVLGASMFLATRSQFEADGFRAARAPLIACTLSVVAIWSASFIGQIDFETFHRRPRDWPIGFQACLFAFLSCLLWFAFTCRRFPQLIPPQGKRIAWKMLGSFYLWAAILGMVMLIGAATKVDPELSDVSVLVSIAQLIFPALMVVSWVVHGLALLFPDELANWHFEN